MSNIPQDEAADSSLAFRSEGYGFIGRRCRKLKTDIFRARLLGRPMYFVRGADAARMFYEPGRFTRRGALPKGTLHLLQDEGSVATLDGADHRDRKAMFMAMMTPEHLAAMAAMAGKELAARFSAWEGMDEVGLHGEFRLVICRAVCRWAGLDLSEEEIATLVDELGQMIDNAGSLGPSNWLARARRWHSEAIMRKVVDDIRQHRIPVPETAAASVIALHRGPDGRRMSLDAAAAELINILRPTVAVARFMTFAAVALYQYPEACDGVGCDDARTEAFVQEVRRYYPFFPVVSGIALEPFSWRGHAFEAGDQFVLDLYGTDHDERIWEDEADFRPERFAGRQPDAAGFIPQGGGDYYENHRCAGEWLTVAVMKEMIGRLVRDVAYDVPQQDLSIDLARMPALPASGFLVTGVRARRQ